MEPLDAAQPTAASQDAEVLATVIRPVGVDPLTTLRKIMNVQDEGIVNHPAVDIRTTVNPQARMMNTSQRLRVRTSDGLKPSATLFMPR